MPVWCVQVGSVRMWCVQVGSVGRCAGVVCAGGQCEEVGSVRRCAGG